MIKDLLSSRTKIQIAIFIWILMIITYMLPYVVSIYHYEISKQIIVNEIHGEDYGSIDHFCTESALNSAGVEFYFHSKNKNKTQKMLFYIDNESSSNYKHQLLRMCVHDQPD